MLRTLNRYLYPKLFPIEFTFCNSDSKVWKTSERVFVRLQYFVYDFMAPILTSSAVFKNTKRLVSLFHSHLTTPQWVSHWKLGLCSYFVRFIWSVHRYPTQKTQMNGLDVPTAPPSLKFGDATEKMIAWMDQMKKIAMQCPYVNVMKILNLCARIHMFAFPSIGHVIKR